MFDLFKKKEKDEFDLHKLNDPLSDLNTKNDPLNNLLDNNNNNNNSNNLKDMGAFDAKKEFTLGTQPNSFGNEKKIKNDYPNMGLDKGIINDRREFELLNSKIDNLKLMLDALIKSIEELNKKIDSVEKNKEKVNEEEKYAW